VLALVVVSGGVVGTVQPTSAQSTPETAITECTVISEPGEYVLGGDLVAVGEGPCLAVAATGTVAIDGAGYSVTGGIDGDPGPPSSEGETRELILDVRDLTVDVVTYPFGGIVGDGASGTLENVTAERLDVGSATGWTVESSRIGSGISGLYAGGVTFRNSSFGGTVSFDENAGGFTVVGNTFAGSLLFPEELADSYVAENTFRGSLELSAVGQPPRNVTVANNEFTVRASDVSGFESGAVVLIDGRDNVIRDNRIAVEGPTGDGVDGSNGMFVQSTLTEIRNNTVTGADNAVRTVRSTSTRLVGNTFDGNDVGVRVSGDARLTDNRITDNRVGVLVESGAPVTLRGNLLAGNEEFGVRNLAATVVDARGNDWGDASGPSSAPANDSDAPFADPVTGALANGSGDAVSEGDTPGVSNVRFDPVATDEPDGVPPTDGSPPVDGNESNATDEVYYQVDFVSGAVIERFGPPDSDRFYNDQSRLVRYVHASVADGRYQQDRIVEPAKLDPATDECVSVRSTSPPAFGRTSFTVEFTVADGCELQLTLAAYEKPGPGWSRANASEQRLVGLDEVAVTEAGTYELTVAVPTAENASRAESVSER
jgi:hypothetical protein